MEKHDWIGREVKDRVTGIKGICVGFCQHITGCNTLAITKGDNTTHWFDENRVTLTKKGKKNKLDIKETKEGLTGAGPIPTNSRSMP